MDIRAGTVTVFYLFDVADSIALASVPSALGASAVATRLNPKPATPAYVQYQKPPLVVEGDGITPPIAGGFATRVKLFDYGVVSLALSRSFTGSWSELVSLGPTVIESSSLESEAERRCRALVARLGRAVVGPRERFFSEDYVVFALSELDRPLSADELCERHGEEIALLLRGERRGLSRQERDEVLRHRISYLADDLVIPSWNAALVYDTPAGAQAAIEILEFANSQLLEFRYYDDLLDAELTRTYAELQRPRPVSVLGARRYTRAAFAVHAVLIDVHELTDHAENALKFVGDVYAARLFSLAAARLGLDSWKASVQEKLKTLDDIYRFAVEQTSMVRGEFLELTVVVLILLELVLVLIGALK